VKTLLLRDAAALVTRVLRVLGLSTAAPDELGFGGTPVPAGAAVVAAAHGFCRGVRERAEQGAAPGELRAAVLGALEGAGAELDAAPSGAGALDALTGLRLKLRGLARTDLAGIGRELLADCDRCACALPRPPVPAGPSWRGVAAPCIAHMHPATLLPGPGQQARTGRPLPLWRPPIAARGSGPQAAG